MSRFLADTSGLYALLNRHEPYHTQATHFYRSLPRRSEVIVIEYVLIETMTLFRARGHSPLAVRFREALGRSDIFSLRYSTPEHEALTYKVFRDLADKQWSYVDCGIYAAAQTMGIDTVFSLDHHIDQMGLIRLPK